MLKYFKKNQTIEDKLYNKILSLSRNKLFYTKLGLSDTFHNRIILIFLHISFLFIKIKTNEANSFYKTFYQKMFNFVFDKIELNMREIGYGDMTVNKNMKTLVKKFYNILLNCEIYQKKDMNNKVAFLIKYLQLSLNKESDINIKLVEYFDKYQAFCFDLRADSVLRGELNFEYI